MNCTIKRRNRKTNKQTELADCEFISTVSGGIRTRNGFATLFFRGNNDNHEYIIKLSSDVIMTISGQ